MTTRARRRPGAVNEPVRVFMSGGTTGTSRPTLYTQWDARSAPSSWPGRSTRRASAPATSCSTRGAYGLHNGAFIFDEALHRWLNCVVITTGTGNGDEQPKQVELAIEYERRARS